MADTKLKSPESYREELRARLHTLRDRFQQVEIARRTGLPTANVHRYMKSGKVPAEFCSALSDAFNLSAEWLLKGEGEPVTSDVKAGAAAKAGELLDLVKAMNAVARLRLGAVVGDRDRKRVRELAETLETFDRLRARMNEKSRPVLDQLIDDMGKALSRVDMGEARALRETAVELSRLCTDDEVLERLDDVQSGVEYLSGNLEKALEFIRRVFARRVRDGRFADAASLQVCINFVMALRETNRIAEARRVAGAIVCLVDESMPESPALCELRMFLGNLHIEVGELDAGMRILESEFAKIPPERRVSATILMARGLQLAGIMDYHELVNFSRPVFGRQRLLIRLACLREDVDILKHATEKLIGLGPEGIKPDEYDTGRARILLRVLRGGKSGLKEFNRLVDEHPPVAASAQVRQIYIEVHRGQVARLVGDRRSVTQQVEKTDRAYQQLAPEFSVRVECRLLHLRALAYLCRGRAGQSVREQMAQVYEEVRGWIDKGYRGLLPLPEMK
ncbi:MAG: hypothetical protein K8I27_10965 [Planctomycetes bacterium]|nr:hypothetical protein [Planctomycetota bacterium]